MSTIQKGEVMDKSIWGDIREQVKTISKDIYSSINPPASSTEIDMLEETIGVKLPQSFRNYLSTLNGQKNTEESSRDRNKETPLLGYNTFLSIAGILETWSMLNELFEDENKPIDWVVEDKIQPFVWRKGWIPFTEHEGDCIILDCNPGKNGRYGQVFIRPNVPDIEGVIAESFEEFSNGLFTD